MGTTTTTESDATGTSRPGVRALLRSQPGWFRTLFWVDMWERFSFYGLGAIMFLYASASPADGGLGMPLADSSALYGSYMALVFLAALPGGWYADRVLGARRAAALGAVLITAGHACLAVPARSLFLVGLLLVVAGCGLVKPAITTMINQGNPDDRRREAALSIFFMSIQVSALAAPVVVGLLAERVDWHAGFGTAAVGMIIGLALYLRGMRGFADIGALGVHALPARQRVLVGIGAALLLLVVLVLAGVVGSGAVGDVGTTLRVVGLTAIAAPLLTIALLHRSRQVDRPARVRLRAFALLMLASALFWAMYAQGNGILTEFARSATQREFAGWEVPASWFLSVHPAAILVFAPFAAGLWLRLGDRFRAPAKVAAGLAVMGASWLLLSVGAAAASDGSRVSAAWLVSSYVLQAAGELVLAPAGLALAGAIAPRGHEARYVGVFWLFCAMGAAVGGIAGGAAESGPLWRHLAITGAVAALVALVVALGARALDRRLAAGRPATVAPDPVSAALDRTGPSGAAVTTDSLDTVTHTTKELA